MKKTAAGDGCWVDRPPGLPRLYALMRENISHALDRMIMVREALIETGRIHRPGERARCAAALMALAKLDAMAWHPDTPSNGEAGLTVLSRRLRKAWPVIESYEGSLAGHF